MKISFLGTNGWYTNENGNTPCILVDATDQYVIFDAGNGIYKLDKYITEEKPISLFISHFHLDHVNGLHILPKFNFPKGLDVYVGKNRKKDFETLVHPPYTIGEGDNLGMATLPFELRVHELNDGENNIPFPLSSIQQFHAFTDHGFRIKLDGKIISYSGDCGITDASYKLAENADILIHECSFLSLEKNDTWGHADPTQVASLAKKVHVKKLILTHFGPTDYKTIEDRQLAEKKAKEIFKDTTAAIDDFTINI